MHIVYKAVGINKERQFVSVLAEGEAAMTYWLGEISKPPSWLQERGYFPLAFDRFSAAREFALLYCDLHPGGVAILECYADELMLLPPKASLYYLATYCDVSVGYDPWPNNTVMVRNLEPRHVIGRYVLDSEEGTIWRMESF